MRHSFCYGGPCRKSPLCFAHSLSLSLSLFTMHTHTHAQIQQTSIFGLSKCRFQHSSDPVHIFCSFLFSLSISFKSPLSSTFLFLSLALVYFLVSIIAASFSCSFSLSLSLSLSLSIYLYIYLSIYLSIYLFNTSSTIQTLFRSYI